MASGKKQKEPHQLNISLIKTWVELRKWEYKEEKGRSLQIRLTLPSSLLNEDERALLSSPNSAKPINDLWLVFTRFGNNFVMRPFIEIIGLKKKTLYSKVSNITRTMYNELNKDLGREPIQLIPYSFESLNAQEDVSSFIETQKQINDLNDQILQLKELNRVTTEKYQTTVQKLDTETENRLETSKETMDQLHTENKTLQDTTNKSLDTIKKAEKSLTKLTIDIGKLVNDGLDGINELKPLVNEDDVATNEIIGLFNNVFNSIKERISKEKIKEGV